MADAVPPGLTAEAIEAARSTLGGALAVAERFPGQSGTELLGIARQAFAQAFELTAVIGAAIVIATTILVAAVLRQVGAGAEPDRRPDVEPEEAPADGIEEPSWGNKKHMICGSLVDQK
jgi:DHA2 family multidrug resistance protein-like MFS transporter